MRAVTINSMKFDPYQALHITGREALDILSAAEPVLRQLIEDARDEFSAIMTQSSWETDWTEADKVNARGALAQSILTMIGSKIPHGVNILAHNN